MDCATPSSTKLSELLDTYGLKQHVNFKTHSGGHCLDLIITRSDDCPLSVHGDSYLSDHQSVLCYLDIHKAEPEFKEIKYRKLKDINIAEFKKSIHKSNLNCDLDQDNAHLVSRYNNILRGLLDEHAPTISR